MLESLWAAHFEFISELLMNLLIFNPGLPHDAILLALLEYLSVILLQPR